MNKHQQILTENPELRHENPAEWEMLQELARLDIENQQSPDCCPHCGSEDLKEGGGMVGETVIYCSDCKKILWEDNEGAIRNVF